MGKYFADVHASHESQLQNLPHGLADTDEILACRAKPQTYENILELADALCWQLRFREAIDALTQAIALEPARMEAYRKRGPKYLDTLQFERALADYTHCEQADGMSIESRYRIGMAQYMLQNYDAATAAFAGSLAIAPQDDDMYIADVYWLVLSQLRAEKADEAQKTLKQHYRPDMYVGHHTAYEKAMRVAAGFAPMEDMLAELDAEAAQDADQQRLPCAINKLGQNIIAHRVCAEQMLPAYGEPLREQLFLSVARKKSGCKRGERKNGQQQESQNERQKSFLSHPLPSNLRLGSRSRHKKSVSRIDSTMMHVVTNKMPCMSG